jgi:hypothetical protein
LHADELKSEQRQQGNGSLLLNYTHQYSINIKESLPGVFSHFTFLSPFDSSRCLQLLVVLTVCLVILD